MGWFYWFCSTLNQKLKWNLGVHFGFVEHKNTLFPLSNFDIFSHYCDLFVCLFVCFFWGGSNRQPGCRMSMFLWKCKMPGDFWWEWATMKRHWMESHSLRGLEHYRASCNIYQTICRGWRSTQNSTRDSQPTCSIHHNFVFLSLLPLWTSRDPACNPSKSLVVKLQLRWRIGTRSSKATSKLDFRKWL